jgi:hypothetical protein
MEEAIICLLAKLVDHLAPTDLPANPNVTRGDPTGRVTKRLAKVDLAVPRRLATGQTVDHA